MKLPTVRHEDDRRILIEWNKDIPMARSKVLIVKKKSVLGKHYHNNSDSIFYILKGKGICTLKRANSSTAPVTREWLFEGDNIFVPRGVIHRFELWPDTVMLESATEPYNYEDEIQVTD